MTKYDLKLAADFFFRFARFEYALKTCGYYSASRNGVVADWDRFARHIEPVFADPRTKPLVKAISYYILHPPMKQIVADDVLKWADYPLYTGTTASKILIYIRRVRNNLFHGGKFKGGRLSEPERSDDLMKYAIEMLDACLSYDKNLAKAYNG